MNPFDNFDNYIENAMSSWHCPGVTIAVVKEENVLHQAAYGLRDVEANLPMTLDTCFPIASLTKSFTAMCIALLVEEAKLDWDTPIRDYAPEFILNDAYATQHVTIRDVLSHRTGMAGHFWSSYRLDITASEFIERLKYLKFGMSFREKWSYNNTLYIAIAYLVEKLAHQNWQDFLHERIFSPLGMAASVASLDMVPEVQLIAKGYRVKRDDEGIYKATNYVPFENFTELSPGMAGSIFSTVPDLIRWLKLQLGKGKLVTANNLRQMHLPQIPIPIDEQTENLLGTTSVSYGLGWFIESYKGHTLISHSGELEGHTTWVAFIPKENIAVAILTNLTENPLAHVLMRESINRALGLPHEDWNSKLHKIVDPMYIEAAKTHKELAKKCISDAPPSRSLESYVGTYKAHGYPEFKVRLEKGCLEACTVSSLDWSELRHYHYDTFEWHLTNYDSWMKLHFTMNSDGNINRVTLPLEPTTGDIGFERETVA